MLFGEVGRVLIVDDYENWRIALSKVLEGEGLHVEIAGSFLEARTILVRSGFEVVVIDVRLVDRDTFNVEGLQLRRFIKNNFPNTRVLLITAYPESIQEQSQGAELVFKVPPGKTFDTPWFKSRVIELIQESLKSRM